MNCTFRHGIDSCEIQTFTDGDRCAILKFQNRPIESIALLVGPEVNAVSAANEYNKGRSEIRHLRMRVYGNIVTYNPHACTYSIGEKSVAVVINMNADMVSERLKSAADREIGQFRYFCHVEENSVLCIVGGARGQLVETMKIFDVTLQGLRPNKACAPRVARIGQYFVTACSGDEQMDLRIFSPVVGRGSIYARVSTKDFQIKLLLATRDNSYLKVEQQQNDKSEICAYTYQQHGDGVLRFFTNHVKICEKSKVSTALESMRNISAAATMQCIPQDFLDWIYMHHFDAISIGNSIHIEVSGRNYKLEFVEKSLPKTKIVDAITFIVAARKDILDTAAYVVMQAF